MSIIRAIKHRLGLSVTPANNFVLDASADNGTMKLARESGQDILTISANNIVTGAAGAVLVGNGPAFIAKGLNGIYPVNSWVKLPFATEQKDTNNNYNPANSRFTPNIAGFYLFTVNIYINESGTEVVNYCANVSITKNNIENVGWGSAYGDNNSPMGISASGIVYMNGTTDYVDVDLEPLGPSGSLTIFADVFAGVLVRAA